MCLLWLIFPASQNKRSKKSSVIFIRKRRAIVRGMHQVDHRSMERKIDRCFDDNRHHDREAGGLPSDSFQRSAVQTRSETHADRVQALFEHETRLTALGNNPSLLQQCVVGGAKNWSGDVEWCSLHSLLI